MDYFSRMVEYFEAKDPTVCTFRCTTYDLKCALINVACLDWLKLAHFCEPNWTHCSHITRL